MTTSTNFHIEKPKHLISDSWRPAEFEVRELIGHAGTWVTQVSAQGNMFTLFSSREDARRLGLTILQSTGLIGEPTQEAVAANQEEEEVKPQGPSFDFLVRLLEAVEWGGNSTCPCCEATMHRGHEENCALDAALRGKEAPLPGERAPF